MKTRVRLYDPLVDVARGSSVEVELAPGHAGTVGQANVRLAKPHPGQFGMFRVAFIAVNHYIPSRHGNEALTATDGFIDQMKQIVSIWKHPVFAGNDDG